MKRCSKCAETKPLDQFWKNRSTRDGVQSWCKPCWYHGVTLKQLDGVKRERALRLRRNAHLLNKYRITLDEYEAMLAAQDGGCAICAVKFDFIGRSLAVDHDAVTGQVRGILCSLCNRGIGQLHHDPARLRAAADYLEAAAMAVT